MASDELLDYYQRELTYLRKAGLEFARSYPKVARRLELGPDQSEDPNVERLIEAFAFLTGRLQRNLEAEVPRLSASLLGLVQPHLVNPVPALSVARFDIDPEQGKLSTGFLLPRTTQLFARTESDVICRFRTCYDLTLWPLRISEALVESVDPYDFLDTSDAAAVLRIRLDALDAPFGELPIQRLRLYLDGDAAQANALHELLLSGVQRVVFLGPGGDRRTVAAEAALHPVGFEADEAVLPHPGHAHQAYRLMHEYFCFPEKFRFIDLAIPPGLARGKTLDVLLLLSVLPRQRLSISPGSFALGCTPVANLFTKVAEPIRVQNRQTEYRVVGDYRRERTTEVHSVTAVTGLNVETGQVLEYRPFFSFNHAASLDGAKAFWTLHRDLTGRPDLPGTDLMIGFLDLNAQPALPPTQTVTVETLCTNRTLAEQVPAGARLRIEREAPLARIVLLQKPTPPRAPPTGGETLWRLVSHLSLNYLSLQDGAEGLNALREILRLHAPAGDAAAEQQVQGLRSLSCRPGLHRIGTDAWRGFCRGIEVTAELDERRFVGGNPLLFAAVLDRFLGMYTSLNSFTRLKVVSSQRSGTWKVWPPRSGTRPVL